MGIKQYAIEKYGLRRSLQASQRKKRLYATARAAANFPGMPLSQHKLTNASNSRKNVRQHAGWGNALCFAVQGGPHVFGNEIRRAVQV
jgi:hypothetical protein